MDTSLKSLIARLRSGIDANKANEKEKERETLSVRERKREAKERKVSVGVLIVEVGKEQGRLTPYTVHRTTRSNYK